MKRNIAILLVLTLLATCIAGNSDAQFWKRKSKRRHAKNATDQNNQQADSTQTKLTKHERKAEKKKEKKDRKKQKHELKHERKENKKKLANEKKHPHVQVVAAPVTVVRQKQEIQYPQSQLKTRYRVDVLASLYLDDFAKNGSTAYTDRIPGKAMPGISFYEGLNIAADSLKKAGFSFDIYVHDVASSTESVAMLIKSGTLDATDLIIGALQTQDVPMIAGYAKKKQVNFISALSASDAGVKDNEYYTILQPTMKTYCQWIAGDIKQKFTGMNVTLLCRTSSSADETVFNYLINDTAVKVNYKQLLCNAMPSKDNLASLFDTTKSNIVVVAVLDTKYADSLLKQLSQSFPATHFEVYGMPSWSGIGSLRKEGVFPNLTVRVPMPFNIDQTGGVGKYVARMYKEDYGGKAPEMAYRGFEAMFWYANLLKHYGTIFNLKYEDNSSAPFTRFDIKPEWDNEGNFLFYENKHVFLSKYENGVYGVE